MLRTVDKLQLLVGCFARLEPRTPTRYSRLTETSPDTTQSTGDLLVDENWVRTAADVFQHDVVVDDACAGGEGRREGVEGPS